ncbi:dynein regulatory complex protein 8-like [Cydia fagiglandana]|uniref:dynein regulatory complex protein 8-like n=1 Tax=Cydia fagiglandana TaxID=1458189 RepID=UPI002FEE06E6
MTLLNRRKQWGDTPDFGHLRVNPAPFGSALLRAIIKVDTTGLLLLILCRRFYPADAETLLASFRYFDEEGRGYLTKERFTKLMLEEGECFTPEEFEEMMQIALDPVTDTITYEYYINQLMVAPKTAYDIADAHTAELKRLEDAAPKKRRASDLLRGTGA